MYVSMYCTVCVLTISTLSSVWGAWLCYRCPWDLVMGSEGISSWTFATAVAKCTLMSVHTYMHVLVHVHTGIYNM